MSSPSKQVLLMVASTAMVVTTLSILLPSNLGKCLSRRKSVVLRPEHKKLLDRAEREDLHKALAEAMELVEQKNKNSFALEKLQEKLRLLEEKLAANDIALDELTDSFEESLRRHQQLTNAALSPIRSEIGLLKDRLNDLTVLLKASSAPTGCGGGKQRLHRQQEQREGNFLGVEAIKSNVSHLTTVATALGMRAAYADKMGTENMDAATPAYIISDWSELSSK
ncbi:Hypothetical protein NocV09_01801030 [Nannochloropsis oceanica]